MKENSARGMIALTASVSIGVATFFTLYSVIPITRPDEPKLGSLFLGVMMAFVMGSQVFTPALVSKLSLRGTLSGSIILLATGALITGLAKNTAALLAAAIPSGIGFGILIVAGSQGVGLLITGVNLARALGVYGLVTMAASAIGSPLGVQAALTLSPETFGLIAFLLGLFAVGLTFGIPAATGKGEVGRNRSLVSRPLLGAPILALTLLFFAVVLLSHGLTSFPAEGAVFGSAAGLVFAVQTGNALGRALGGEIQTRSGGFPATIIGATLLLIGGAAGVFANNFVTAALAGALLGFGVGVVQTLTLHIAMLRMGPGSASVVWNITVDGGLWLGGVLWGVALATGAVSSFVLIFIAFIAVSGTLVALQLRLNRGSGST